MLMCVGGYRNNTNPVGGIFRSTSETRIGLRPFSLLENLLVTDKGELPSPIRQMLHFAHPMEIWYAPGNHCIASCVGVLPLRHCGHTRH